MKKIMFLILFILIIACYLLFSHKTKAKDNAVLVSKDPDQYYMKKIKYKSIIPWRKGIYVSGNVDTYNPEMVPEFSNEIVEGIRGHRKNEKRATEGFYKNENLDFDESSPFPTSPYP